MTHTVGPVSVLAAVFVVLITASIAAYYYSNMQSDMRHRAKTTTEFFASYIGQSYSEYYQSCATYARTFEEKIPLSCSSSIPAVVWWHPLMVSGQAFPRRLRTFPMR